MVPWWSWLGYPVQSVYDGLNLSELKLNQAFVKASSSVDKVGIYTLSDDCVACPFKLEQSFTSGTNVSWAVDISSTVTWRIMNYADQQNISTNVRKGLICQIRPYLKEFGVYSLDIGSCKFDTELDPINIYYPLLVLLLLICGSVAIFHILRNLAQVLVRFRNRDDNKSNIEGYCNAKPPEIPENVNMAALYVFRGLMLSLIIFLKTGGGGYPFLTKDLGGLTLADCFFYCYVWSIGLKIPATIEKAYSEGETKCKVFTDILKRSSSLMLIGTVIDSTINYNPATDDLVLWCPLQRIGIAYFIAATAYALTYQKFEMDGQGMIWKAVSNLMSLLWCWIIGGFLFAMEIILIVAFISFNCQSNIGLKSPNFEPSDLVEIVDKCTNDMSDLTNYIFMAESKDLFVNIFLGYSKGLMGLMITIIQCMIGMKAGVIYSHWEEHGDRIKLWNFWGGIFSIGAMLVTGATYVFKINLWPLTTLLVISTASFMILSLIYLIVEDYALLKVSELKNLGLTSMAVLTGHLLLSRSFPFNWNVEFNNHLFYLLQNCWIVCLWMVIGMILTKKSVRFSI